MSKLAAAVKALSGALAEACPLQQAVSAGDGEGQVVLRVASPEDGAKVVLNLVFFEPDAYPRSGVLLQVDEAASKCPAAQADKLAALSERFQDAAQLSAVIAKVCAVLDIPLNEELLRLAEKQAAAAGKGGGGGAGTSGSGMDDDGGDASADPMSEDYPDTGSASDGGYASGEEEGDDDGDDDDEKEVMIECGQRQGRWNRHEDELAASDTAQALSMEQGKASKQQIFSTQEAFRMLSNELLGFIRRQATGQDLNVSADSVGDDVYTWNVWLWRTGFKPDCRIAKDLQELSTTCATSAIQLRVSFMRGLHPFYPPRLEVVRPHLAPPLPGALSSHPLLRLENWNPTMNMLQLLHNIRDFLEEHGSIDVANPRNNEADHPTSAYGPVALALARLEALTDVKPACYARHSALYEARCAHGRRMSGEEDGQEQACPKKARTAQPSADGAADGAAAGAGAAARVVWAKGTGFGYGGGYRGAGTSGPVWDAKAAAAAQEAQDEQLYGLLQGLAAALQQELGSSSSGGGGDAGGAAAAAAAPSSSRAASSSGQQQQQLEPMDTAPAGTPTATSAAAQAECLAAVRASVLLPLLVRELGQVSFTEMVDRHHYYQPLLAIVEAMCCPASEHLLAGNAAAPCDEPGTAAAAAAAAGGGGGSSAAAAAGPERVCSIAAATRGLQKSASLFKDRMGKVLEQQQKAKAAAAGSSSGAKKVDKQAEALHEQAMRSLEIAGQVLRINDKLQHLTTAEDEAAARAAAAAQQQPAAAAAAAAAAPRAPRRTTRSTANAAAAAAAAAAAGGPAAAAAGGEAAPAQQQDGAASAAAYVAALKPHVLDSAAISAFHKFKDEAARDPMGLKARVQRVTSEMAGIERLIDVNESSSIFVRVDDDNSFLWRALITGPEDTPYSGGCFLFDIFFPPNYPTIPPKVLITTTGGGSVRFNPNLYNCGKVCLSLLGTWSGGQGEGWNPEASSALQVLVSIQSLILVEQPYFNEPGFEQRGDDAASRQYNENIREKTIQWAMVDQLRKPPAEFAQVIREHFRLRKGFILRQIDAWISEAVGAAHRSSLKAHKASLEEELAKL